MKGRSITEWDEITQEVLLDHFEYDSGKLYWKVPRANWIPKGSFAGGYRKDGYYQVGFLGRPRLGHRIIWKMFYGDSPELIDHIDQNPSNNLITNLRASNKRENALNTSMFSHNTSGIKGVSRQGKSWVASAKVGKLYVRKYFKTVEEAISCREALLEKGGQGNGKEFLDYL